MTVRRVVPLLLAFTLGLGVPFLAACGERENPAMLPAETADELKNHLDDVLAAIASEDCADTRQAIAQVEADLGSLPSGTSVRLQEELRRGVDQLEKQADEECKGTETETETTETETVPTVTEPPVTEPPVTEPPHTEPPVTEPPVTEPPVTEPPVTEPPPERDTSDTGGVEVVPE